MISPACDEVRLSLPAYVMEALDSDERMLVREHMAACVVCQAETAEFIELVGLLGELSTAEAAVGPLLSPSQQPPTVLRFPDTGRAAAGDPAPQGVPGAVLDLAQARARRGRRPVGRRLLFGVAAALVLGLGVGGGYTLAGGSGHGTGAPSALADPPVFPTAASGERTVSAVDSKTNTRATVRSLPEGWGSRVELTLTRNSVPHLERCRLVAVGRDGEKQVAATWKADHGGTFSVPGGMAMSPDEVAHYDVYTLEGKRLISVST